jgi:hypothetical protein
MYSEPKDFDKNFERILDLIHKRMDPQNKFDESICSAIECGNGVAYVQFDRNRHAQGAIIGIGLEPDVPHENMRQEFFKLGALHRGPQLRLVPEQIFVITEEWKDKKKYLYITGAKTSSAILALPPHMETYRMTIKRKENKQIKKIGKEHKSDLLLEHKSWINTYLDTNL